MLNKPRGRKPRHALPRVERRRALWGLRQRHGVERGQARSVQESVGARDHRAGAGREGRHVVQRAAIGEFGSPGTRAARALHREPVERSGASAHAVAE